MSHQRKSLIQNYKLIRHAPEYTISRMNTSIDSIHPQERGIAFLSHVVLQALSVCRKYLQLVVGDDAFALLDTIEHRVFHGY